MPPTAPTIKPISTDTPTHTLGEVVSAPAVVSSGDRDELIRLGRSGKPWAFLARGTRAVENDPSDAEMAFLVAANFARLHLKTAAAELLMHLPEKFRKEAGVGTLIEMVYRLPADEITAASRTLICAANLETLALRGIDLSAEFRLWHSKVEDRRFFRAMDGNVVSTSLTNSKFGRLDGLADHRGDARAFAHRHLSAEESRGRPHTLEGIDPPWILQHASELLARCGDGHVARINVIERDPIRALDGLSFVDLTSELCQHRLHLYIGDHAIENLARDLRALSHTGITGPFIPRLPARSAVADSVESLFSKLEREQLADQASLSAAAQRIYVSRDRAWWNHRFEEAHNETGPKLRVLVPTCRYTTFVKHSASDLASALERAGCAARVLIEPDDTCHLNGLAYLKQIVEWKPDLVVLINYTRATLRGMFGPIIPLQLPFVCWIQDAMPHLFRDSAGAQHGEFDFLIGHQHKELFERFGYAKERTMACSVVASERKFHPAPVDASLRRRHECEIAYASRHAETVEALHARLCGEVRHNPPLVRVFEHLYPQVRALGEHPTAQFAHASFDTLASEALVATQHPGPQPDLKLVALIAKQYCGPLAERAVRHQTLHWAADIAEKNGWRLNVYGHGWESHSRFARYAKGELNHGEELRASYQGAAAHLHATVHFLMHQRVVECVLSGGYPMLRMNMEEVSALFWASIGDLFARDLPPNIVDPSSGQTAFQVADHPTLMRMMSLRQRMGLQAESTLTFTENQRKRFAKRGEVPHPAEQSLWLLGDSAENFFDSPTALERNVRTAIERPDLRRATSRLAAERITPCLTYHALVHDVLSLVRKTLSGTKALSRGTFS